MRLLIVTKLFPNAAEPSLAPYNRHQFRELSKRCEVDLLALVPWLPGMGLARLGAKSEMARRRSAIPREEQIDGMVVRHPRVLYAPKLGRPLSGPLYAASLLPYVMRRREGYDAVLGSFAYPDGWAAVALARVLGVPAVIKLHGSDINIYGADPLLRSSLTWALSRAAAVVGPSQALVDRAIDLGADARRSRAIRNGIDRSVFRPRDRAESRAALGRPSDKKQLVFIGRVEKQKGVLELLEAMRLLPEALRREAELVMVGDGVDREVCEALARQHALPVHFAGVVAPDQVALHIGASDVVVLPSWAEGTPNVIIEALASGRRVVASDVGGIPVVVDDPRLGELVPARQAAPLSEAIGRALGQPYDAAAVADLAKFPTWVDNANALFEVLDGAIRERAH